MTDNIIVDTASRIFADLCEPATINAAEEGKWPQALWQALEESGLPLTWVGDDLGGAGAYEIRKSRIRNFDRRMQRADGLENLLHAVG